MTFADLSSSYFALAQNSATENTTRYIPTTISKEAQEELQKITFDPSIMKSPLLTPNNINGNNQGLKYYCMKCGTTKSDYP